MKRRIINSTGNAIYGLAYTHRKKTLSVFAILFLLFWFSLPRQLFDDPTSAVLTDRNGNLLGARTAADGQWRFPATDTVPFKFKASIITFEDKRFYSHPGVDVRSFSRAIWQNLTNGEVVSGGSTLSMQIIRMSRKGRSRNVWNKFIEATLALRMEITYSKEEILALYASNAPFGGNVVGLDAASWRYFGRRPDQLSWAESATLAVLPNSPSLVHPGKNRKTLKEKRDRLLDKLCAEKFFDTEACALSKLEPLPGAPLELPDYAPHLLERVRSNDFTKPGVPTLLQTTIDGFLQQRATEMVTQHLAALSESGINNASAIIAEVETGDVVAYVGNARTGLMKPGEKNIDPNGYMVDVINAPRSSGSILKPFLYASMLSDGEILPNTLVPDIPTYFGSYSPKNYNQDYDGAVPAHRALARSLNVPAVRMLSHYGQPRMYAKFKSIGMSTLNNPSGHYGLSLILGGAETKLWDLAGMYSGMARTVNDFEKNGGKYDRENFRALNFDLDLSKKRAKQKPVLTDQSPITAGACYSTLQAMEEVERPEEEGHWRDFTGKGKIAWKTGTSYGFRDAWAVGVNKKYVVAVWVGNADGEGRPGLIGIEAAAPILFDLFGILKDGNEWFDQPLDDMRQIDVCSKSGQRALDACEEKISQWVPASGLRTLPCSYHKEVHLDATGQFQVHSDCESPSAMIHTSWFVLPPAEEEYYRHKHADYKSLPPFRQDCKAMIENLLLAKNMEFIYPRNATRIYVPIELDGSAGSTVFEVAHRQDNMKIYWHLDDKFVGTTETFHQMALKPKLGTHVITAVDENGEKIQQRFEILSKKAEGDE